MECRSDYGFRWQRVLPDGSEGWIAGCFYDPADNDIYSSMRNGGYRVVNHGILERVVDIYTYYPGSDTVTKGRMTKSDYDAELALAEAEIRYPVLPEQVSFSPPPSNPDDPGFLRGARDRAE